MGKGEEGEGGEGMVGWGRLGRDRLGNPLRSKESEGVGGLGGKGWWVGDTRPMLRGGALALSMSGRRKKVRVGWVFGAALCFGVRRILRCPMAWSRGERCRFLARLSAYT